jgi:hypothetical protein
MKRPNPYRSNYAFVNIYETGHYHQRDLRGVITENWMANPDAAPRRIGFTRVPCGGAPLKGNGAQRRARSDGFFAMRSNFAR